MEVLLSLFVEVLLSLFVVRLLSRFLGGLLSIFTPRRRLSKNLHELMNRLKKHAASFIRGFDNREQRMRQIVGEFQSIASEVRRIQERTNSLRTIGVGGIGLGVLAAPFTEGLSWLIAVGAVAVAAYVDAKAKKRQIENQSAEEVLNRGKEFLRIVEPLKNELEEIKRTCERLEEESAAFQAEKTLSDMEEFQRILGRVAELRRRKRTAEEDRTFRESILQSADLCLVVIYHFDQMQNELSVFRGY